MSIRTKVFLIIFVLFAVLGTADFIVQRFVIYPSFLELEHHEAGENLQRIFHAIRRESYHLERFCRDWSTWDDSHDFMATGSADFIASNLSDEALDNISLNLMIFLDTNGTIFWARARDFVNKRNLALDFITKGSVPLDNVIFDLQPTKEGGRGKNGIFNTEMGPMLFATREIVHSDGSGPMNGYLLMGRFLDRKMLESLREQTRIPFDIAFPFQETGLMCETSGIAPSETGGLRFFTEHEGAFVKACAAYTDESGAPLFGVHYLFPREITQKGITSMRYAAILVFASGVIILGILNFLLQAVVLRPLQRLTEHAARLQEEGDYSMRLDMSRSDEVGVLARSFDTMVQTVSERTEELKRANERLTQLSMRDGMTGIANRRMFDAFIQQEWRRATRERTPLSVILADVDFFKNYNDSYGHQQGDQCLIAVAAVLQREAQRPADLVDRYGGEEFIVVLPNTDAEGALHMAEALRHATLDLHLEHRASEADPCVTLSMGVVTLVPEVEDGDKGIEALLEKADQALYKAKKTGRNRVVAWTPE